MKPQVKPVQPNIYYLLETHETLVTKHFTGLMLAQLTICDLQHFPLYLHF